MAASTHLRSIAVSMLATVLVIYLTLRLNSPPIHAVQAMKKPRSDVPKRQLQLDLPTGILQPEETVRYDLDTEDGIQHWSALVPPNFSPGGGGANGYTITLFHQLHCLNALREAITDTTAPTQSALAEHCINYLRQMSLCQGRTHLEPVHRATPPKFVDHERSVYMCQDWKLVYEKAKTGFEDLL